MITTVGGKRITTIEPTITKQFPAALYPNALKTSAVFQQTVPLRPGLYKIDLVIKDVHGDVIEDGDVVAAEETNLDAHGIKRL